MIFTPFDVVTISSGRVRATFPPLAAARSTHTDPGFITDNISSVTKIGACLPGIRAVVMITSTSLA
jgi:hypothetical protein